MAVVYVHMMSGMLFYSRRYGKEGLECRRGFSNGKVDTAHSVGSRIAVRVGHGSQTTTWAGRDESPVGVKRKKRA